MNKQKIVVYVDNDIDDLEILTTIFSAIPDAPVIKTFESPQKALQFLTTSVDADDTYYYVLADINMPTMNGFDFVKAMKQSSCLAHLDVSLITTSPNPRDKDLAMDLGVDLVVKPVTIDALTAIAKDVIEHCNKNAC